MQGITGIREGQHIRQRFKGRHGAAFGKDISPFMAVVHKSASGPGVTTVGGIVFGEHKLAHGIESCRLPRGHKAVHTVPAVEAHHQCVFFKDAVHLQRGRLQPFVRHIPGNLSALTVLKTDEVRRIGHNKVHGTVGESAHHINTVPENESGHGSTPVV